jgi:hypothetical protein
MMPLPLDNVNGSPAALQKRYLDHYIANPFPIGQCAAFAKVALPEINVAGVDDSFDPAFLTPL